MIKIVNQATIDTKKRRIANSHFTTGSQRFRSQTTPHPARSKAGLQRKLEGRSMRDRDRSPDNRPRTELDGLADPHVHSTVATHIQSGRRGKIPAGFSQKNTSSSPGVPLSCRVTLPSLHSPTAGPCLNSTWDGASLALTQPGNYHPLSNWHSPRITQHHDETGSR